MKKLLPIFLILSILALVYGAKRYQYPDSPQLNSEIENIYLEIGSANKTTAKARAYLGTDQTVATDTWTKINLDTETYDIGNNFNTTLKRFIAPVSGYYLILGTLLWKDPVVDKNYYASIYINGSSVAEFLEGSYSSWLKGITLDIRHLNKNDYVELYGFHTSGVDKTAYSGTVFTYMSIHLLSKD